MPTCGTPSSSFPPVAEHSFTPSPPTEREDVLHWLHDVSDRIAIKTTEAPQYRRVALQRKQPDYAYSGATCTNN